MWVTNQLVRVFLISLTALLLVGCSSQTPPPVPPVAPAPRPMPPADPHPDVTALLRRWTELLLAQDYAGMQALLGPSFHGDIKAVDLHDPSSHAAPQAQGELWVSPEALAAQDPHPALEATQVLQYPDHLAKLFLRVGLERVDDAWRIAHVDWQVTPVSAHFVPPPSTEEAQDVASRFASAFLRGDAAGMNALLSPVWCNQAENLGALDARGGAAQLPHMLTPPALEYATVTKEGVQVYLAADLGLPGNKSTHRLSLFVHNSGDGWRIYLLRHQDLADPGKLLGSTRCGERPWSSMARKP